MNPAYQRTSGVLFHPTSLPNTIDAVGTLGHEAYEFIDWLAASGQHLWQILPLNPTGYGDSPYSSFSAFAGNYYLIDLVDLFNIGDLSKEEVDNYIPPQDSFKNVDYGWLYQNKLKILRKAFNCFQSEKNKSRKKKFDKYCFENSYWLNDYALFMSLKGEYNGLSWNLWKNEHKNYSLLTNNDSVERIEDVTFYKYLQWIFSLQWNRLKNYANKNMIKIIGDAPIFVAYDSSDVWSNQDKFYLDESGSPSVVAGVPPDYFSETGQLWGNPLYDWEYMKKNNYSWWIKRIKHLLEMVDVIRIDHFRGFAQYWEIKYGETTAINGRWIDGPGKEFFGTLNNCFNGEIPIIAEDLGLITPDVVKLRDDYELPGMKIFEFAPWGDDFFEDDGVQYEFKIHKYLPENYPKNSVAYLGTHDNDTFIGWFRSLNDNQRLHLKNYLGHEEEKKVLWAAIEKIWSSDADRAIISMQDLLGYDSSCRMNLPGTEGVHNWSWRLESYDQLLGTEVKNKLKKITEDTKR